MIKLLSTISVLSLFSFTAIASGKQTWKFTRTDGQVGVVSFAGESESCLVNPAGKDDTLQISVGSLNANVATCYEDVSRPNHIRSIFTYGPQNYAAEAYLYVDDEFSNLMKQFAEFPNGLGPIGNGVNGTCPKEATAFLMLPGQVTGDPNADVVGYCLIP